MLRWILLATTLAASTMRLPAQEAHCGAYYFVPPTTEEASLTLYLPNSWPRDIQVEKVGNGGTTRWWGLACDEVWLPAGSKFRAVSEGANPNWLYTLRADGYLDYQFSPVEE